MVTHDWEELVTYFHRSPRQTTNPISETIRRLEVPGGWIYEIVKYNPEETPILMSTCFVPRTGETLQDIGKLRLKLYASEETK